MSKLRWRRRLFCLCVLCAVEAIPSDAQTFESLASFDGTNGSEPNAPLVQGFDGNFYGTTAFGGANNDGTVLKITAGGKLTTLHSFDFTDGANPLAGLLQATNGNLYGTTWGGGANSCIIGSTNYGCGTVFEITPGGKLTTLYSFCSQTNCADGGNPRAGLVQATNGNFYGTTSYGGANAAGTVFKITLGGTLTTVYSFCIKANCTDGANPYAGLVQAINGNLYGTTAGGGATYGTVFEITPRGMLTTLHSFDGSDGQSPKGLVQATNGKFYGTTEGGGASGSCPYGSGCGTIFEIAALGTLTTLYDFCAQTGCTDGALPFAGPVQATNGNFYGTASGGGANSCMIGSTNYGCGTVFEITPTGKLTTLHSFDGTDGEIPYAGLVQATNGNFYGTTLYGGASANCAPYGCGTVFSLAVGLGPFVETLPTSGKVGGAVKILAQLSH